MKVLTLALAFSATILSSVLISSNVMAGGPSPTIKTQQSKSTSSTPSKTLEPQKPKPKYIESYADPFPHQ